MGRLTASILVAAACGFGARPALAQAGGDAGTSVLTRPPRGSLAGQLRLKLSLQMAGGTSLAAALGHNRQEWEMLSPDQREQYRTLVLAILKMKPEEQGKLLSNLTGFLSLTNQKREAYRRRDEWVRAVAATFTPEQREDLRKMSSTDRAKALLARRDELVRQGKLNLDEPPALAPAEPKPDH